MSASGGSDGRWNGTAQPRWRPLCASAGAGNIAPPVCALGLGSITPVPDYLYDSAAGRASPRAWAEGLRSRAGLMRLLVSRDLRIRYKRSLLGVWWTLLSPLLEMG